MQTSLTLVIGNKNYSSWSLRPWLLLRHFEIAFEEELLKFHSAGWDRRIARLSPSNLVPVLWDGAPGKVGSLCVWDTLAICEYIADRFPQRPVWPTELRARARARSIAAEMHAGFRALRSAMPMNLRSQHPGKGFTTEAAADIRRIETLWRETRAQFGDRGPFLFGAFSAADAMYAPVVMRFNTYHPPVAGDTRDYCDAINAHPALGEWSAAAKLETEFEALDEPYASAPG